MVPKKPAKQSGPQTARCNSQQHHSATPDPKRHTQQEIQSVNLLYTQYVRTATARRVHRTPKLSSKSCQAPERFILLGLCCTLEEVVVKSSQTRGRNAETLGDQGRCFRTCQITDQPHFEGSGSSQLHDPQIVENLSLA